ncbi:MAG: hypothetical protein ABIA62_02135 [Candidatus Woesearchaeota archaeon]
MGFFDFVGGKVGAGRKIQKAVLEEAHRSEIAAKKLVNFAKMVEAPIRDLINIRQPMTSADLMSEKDRRKILSVIEPVAAPGAAKEIQTKVREEVVNYLQGFHSALITLKAEYAITKAASKVEMERMLSAGLKESQEETVRMMKEAQGAINRLNMKRAQEIRDEYNKAA